MPQIHDIDEFLEAFAPVRLAEDWDNVGLLVGDSQRDANRIMTCLTVTPASAAEAVREHVDLIVSHHPLPFRPLKRLTTDTTPGRLLLQLVGAGVSIYSPHTAFDSAARGINQSLAKSLGIIDAQPLVAFEGDADQLGSGRVGTLPEVASLQEIADRIKQFLGLTSIQAVGAADAQIERAAVACGAAGEFLEPALKAHCQLFVTGETSFHTLLEAESQGIALLLLGHYASERFGVESLARTLAEKFPDVEVWPSRDETDPLKRL